MVEDLEVLLYSKVNTSSIMILPLYNSLIKPVSLPKPNDHLIEYFHILCWDNGLINTYLDNSFYFKFDRKLFKKNMIGYPFSISDLIGKLDYSLHYSNDKIIVLRHTPPMKWFKYIDAIKTNKLEELDNKYLLSTIILENEVPIPKTPLAQFIVKHNLPWGILANYDKLADKISDYFKTPKHLLSQYKVPIFDPEKEQLKYI